VTTTDVEYRNYPRIARIFSGGQSGADRAALDAAIAHGIPYGGWCPLGGWAEDYPDPPGLLTGYPRLWESESVDPSVRTALNVRDSHATIIIRGGENSSPGTDLTAKVARELGRPNLITNGDVEDVYVWLETLGRGLTINVAGPRASEFPDVYLRTRNMLDVLFQRTTTV